MDGLFLRPDGSPMQFYLADLDTEQKTKYTLLIEDSGGKVQESPNENVVTFTTPEQCLKHKFVFNVQFIDDCIAEQKILNINSYYLGDERHNRCLLSKGMIRDCQCINSNLKYEKFAELLKNKMSTRYATLKSIESKQKQNSRQKIVPPPKKNTLDELDIQTSNNLEQKILKMTVSNKNVIQSKESKTNIIQETSSETENSEIPPSPVLKTNSRAKRTKRKVAERKIAGSSKPSTSEDKLGENCTIIVSSDNEYENRPQENSKKVVKRKKQKRSEVEDQDDSEENTEEESLSDKLLKFIEETVKDKKLDPLGYPESYSYNFEPWETRAMIQFLIITERVHEARDVEVWKYAHAMKFLPRKRSSIKMQNHFKTRILPNIEYYNLTPQQLEQFKALGPPKRVLENSCF